MFEFIRTHQRLMQFLLLLIIFPSFAFFGLESYTSMGDASNTVAKVDGQTITQPEWDAAQREQMARFRQMFGEQFDAKMFDTPEAKQEVLNNLIAQRVLAAEAKRNKLSVSDQSLQQTIINMGGLTTADGKFDVERYKTILAAQGMTPTTYEARLRQDMISQQVNAAIQSTAFAPDSLAKRLSELGEQEREVQQLAFRASDYVAQVKVTDDMLKAYYDKSNQFDVPEQVKAEYVVLTADALAAQINVSDADIKSYYEQNTKQYGTEEQRRASHILIGVSKDASDADKAAAKAKAEKLLASLRKNPQDFAKLAKENSIDTGSAERGGDLGFFGKGSMVKPFEDAAYKLKQDELSDLVQSDYGFHIIKVTAIKPAAIKPLEQVKGEIASDIRKQLVVKKYTETADVFNNTVYEQADSLKAVADKLKLKIETTGNLSRQVNPAVAPSTPYNNQKFLTALFSDESLKNKRNTEAVEVAPNTLISGRVVEYKPATKRPFDEVKALVQERVVQTEAHALAKKAGEAKLAALKEKDDATGFSATQVVSRAKSQGLNPAVFLAVMKADTSKLPSYVGLEAPQGYAVLRVVRVVQPTNVDSAKRQAERQQITAALAQQETYAYIEALKKKAKVEIKKPTAAKSETAE
ncbi:SurA N-terminal domain-containing protein [Herminiimonas fonticola]|uniref:Periplasmic chaperone PpiD n=1 Tax=Herminiimonas fonticola TaxID=303380 RepID=A0A4R6G3V5_9BURK|nr:SurA N-terminal domain-containing protein [Herminiimonas fonticola]RBA23451.1 SurA N-terminal domain [Herminiimonas fonticola]TDN88294.1 peptidyl-prolyl cis-trans isomerase D [Herminiimonas fonticola]